MDNFTLLNQVLIIFLIMLTGVYARKRNIIDDKLNKGLTSVLLNLTLPLNIIASFNVEFSKDLLFNIMTIFLFGALMHPISFFIGKLLFRNEKKEEKNILIFSAIFSNCGFMAFPILDSLYGKTGVLYGSIFLAPFNIYLWTLGVRLFSEDAKTFKIRNIINPGIVAVILGLIIFIFYIKLPFPVQRCFEIVGSMTTPLSMMITGVIIAELKISEIFSSMSIYKISFVRLVLIPILFAAILKLIGVAEVVYGICILISAMPVAAMSTVFAERFSGNSAFASKSVFITTIISLITIPLIAFFLL